MRVRVTVSGLRRTRIVNFGHAKVIDYCERPFVNADDMNRQMAVNWNLRVAPEDTVYHLGDFAMGPRDWLPGFREHLNGRIILIKGNHDRSKKAMLAAGFDEVHEELYLPCDGVVVYLHHQPRPREYWEGFADVHLHGHVHCEYARQGDFINVGVDVRNFSPSVLAELL